MNKHTKMLLVLTFLMFLVGFVEAQDKKTFTIGNVSFNMIYVKGGTFLMGDTTKQGTNAKATEKPAHTVTLESYYIGETEVTQGLWNVIMGYNNSICRKGDNYPVDVVSWEEIVNDFLPTLNKLTKNTFRLPTEAEWEYAARGGELQRTTQYSGSNFLNYAAWSKEDQSRKIKERTSRTITYSTAYHNALDLYDMSGNVSEWCQDAWDGSTNYKDAPTDGSANQKGDKRVVRGGSCIDEVEKCRVYARDCEYPDAWRPFLGFRLVLNVPKQE